MIMNAFELKTNISEGLQRCLGIIILSISIILILICVLSMSLGGNYINLQKDNAIIRDFRIDYLLRLAVE